MVKTPTHAWESVTRIGNIVQLTRGSEPTSHLTLSPILRESYT
jgi:hypothetical protein